VLWGYQRPADISLSEKFAERWICKRYNWDWFIFTRRASVGDNKGSGAYRIVGSRGLWQAQPKIPVLRIAKWSRFGNSVMQLINCFYVAEALRADTLEFAKPHPFFEADRVGPFSLRISANPTRGKGTVLEGMFFMMNAFRMNLTDADCARITETYLGPLVAPSIATPDPRVLASDLVMHFRGGDVFRTDKPPHRGYGQPPMEYYLGAFEREKPARVWLVSEDRANPCVEGVANYLAKRGVEVVLQSDTLANDLRVLMSAECLVAGRGSFAPMLGLLSTRLRRFYHLGKNGRLEPMRLRGVDIITASDTDGEYQARIFGRNWTGSAEQLELMLTYPRDKISFRRSV
jgi:hypothetical protein